MKWEEKFEYKNYVFGVLVCGSYITGSPNNILI